MKKSVKLLFFVVLSLTLIIAGCGGEGTNTGSNSSASAPADNQQEDTVQINENDENLEEAVKLEGKIVVYSNRNEKFTQALLDKFAQETGLEVVPLHGADALKLEEEANNVQADIFISNEIGALSYLHEKGLLEGSSLKGIETIPAEYRADDNAYFAISSRARGFIYNKDLISEEDMPKSIEDLSDSKWKDKFAITRGGNASMIAHISALRYEWGDEKTAEWIKAISENAGGITNGHGDIRKAVGAGEYTFGLVNNYYFHQQLMEPENNNVAFIYLDQEEGQMGAVTNAAGAALVKGAPNAANAQAFLEWVLLPENQVAFVGESLELLINSDYGAAYPPEVQPHIVDYKELKVQALPLKELGKYFEDSKEMIEKSGLALELK